MKVVYACSFNLKRYSGKNRATRQKLESLRDLVEQLHIISAGNFLGLNYVLIDIKAIILIIRLQPQIFISRGFVGLLPTVLCKFLGCRTVREVHGDSIGEADLLDKNLFLRMLLKILGFYTSIIDQVADVRVFNHPTLMNWFHKNYASGPDDFYCYNGYLDDSTVQSSFDRELVLSKYGLPGEFDYLVFVGSASKWHGLSYLVNLQKIFNDTGENLKIICAGGKVTAEIDPENVLINIYPLDDNGCDELICISKACLLPVNDTRVSPGSPLKLYDYIKHQKFIITQEEMLGYSDEVETYGRGICVDFKDARETARVLSKLDTSMPILTPIDCFSWNARMKKWINMFEGILQRDGP